MKRDKPTLLISTYGSHKSGTGHIFRDLELARSLRPHADVVFHMDGSDEARAILNRCGIKLLPGGTLKNAIAQSLPDLIIYDKPYTLGRMGDTGATNDFKILSLDNFYYDDHRIDIAINIINHHHHKRSKRPGIKQVLEGTQYAIVRDDILKFKNIRRGVRRRVRNILVTFGGADPKNHTAKVIRSLEGIKESKFKIKIVRGYVFRKGRQYLPKKTFHNYVLQDRVVNMGELMGWADLAFCGAGTTLMELLCNGCPTIVFPQTKDERAFAKSLANQKALMLLPSGSNMVSGRRKIEKVIHDVSLRRKMFIKGKELFDGFGKERIKQLILEHLNRN